MYVLRVAEVERQATAAMQLAATLIAGAVRDVPVPPDVHAARAAFDAALIEPPTPMSGRARQLADLGVA